MNRKNTILTAVAINAGLLAILLIAALTNQEETNLPSVFVGDAPQQKIDDNPLFGDSVDLALRQPLAVQPEKQETVVQIPLPEKEKSAETPLAQLPIPAASEEPLVHKLPQPAIELPPQKPVAVTTSSANISQYIEVTVQKGDSLEKIARQYRTSVDEIIKINQLPSSFLRVGQVLKIPAEKSVSTMPKLKAPTEKKSEGNAEYYTVKVGDNPWTIAMKHHIKVDELLRLNGLNEERARKLKPGDRLRTR
jgi:peptidoglycan endopeptidase LytF